MDEDVFQALPVPGRGEWCDSRPRGPSSRDTPRVEPEVARMIALILHIHRQKYEDGLRDFLRVFFTGVRNTCEYLTLVENVST